MVDFDPANEQHPAKLFVLGGKPSIAELKAAIRASAVSGRYSDDFIRKSTKNDLLYICRQNNIAVTTTISGLPTGQTVI